jgi:hypothetical protein
MIHRVQITLARSIAAARAEPTDARNERCRTARRLTEVYTGA